MTALQEEVTSHRKGRRSRAARAERCGKRRDIEHVRYDPMKASERTTEDVSKAQTTSKPGRLWAWDEPGGDLSTAQAVSGI